MNPIIEISKLVSDAFAECGYDADLGKTSLSNRPDLCQFTCNGAMSGAKAYKKPPLKIATDVTEVLNKNPIFEKVEAIPPGFINIILKNEYYENLISRVKSFGDLVETKSGCKVIVDYGGPNVAKPLHVGHLRPAIIGESLKRISRALGNETIGDIHLGDWGLPMGLIITEIQERYPDLNYFKEDYTPSESDSFPVSIDELNEIYPASSAKSKIDDAYKSKAQEITKKLQNKEIGYYNLWKQFVKLSTSDMKKIYDSLNVSYDLWNGESSCSDYIEPLINKLVEKGITCESEGALIVDIKQEEDKLELPPILIRKSDGAQLYSTTDLATIMQREEMFQPDQIIYVTDSRQSLHFTQVFRCAKKGELVSENTALEFVNLGTMNGKDGKPYKTRDGGVMQLSELIQAIIDEAYIRVDKNISDGITEDEKKAIAKKVGIAALKFGDLYNHRSRDYIFDMERFVSFEGKTGPYLLYNTARINSILNKADFEGGKIKIYSATEQDIIFKILLTEDVLVRAFNEKAPNYICEHVYEIASLFSKFYAENIIISESDADKKASWISLINLIRLTIVGLLELLAIEYVDKM